MAARNWAGAAPRVAKVVTFAFGGTWEADDLVRASFANGKRADFAVGSVTTATAVANVATAWNNLDSGNYPEFAEITASANGTTLTLTHDTAGKDFEVTLAPLEAGGTAADAQTIQGGTAATTGAVATAASGPNFWSVAANWEENAVPATGDDVTIAKGPSILYGLDQGAVTLASLKILPGYPSSSSIGLPDHTNASSPETGYPEYRARRLRIGATVADVESASRRVRLDLSPASTTVTVRDTGQPEQASGDALDLKLAATAAVYVFKGYVGVNRLPGDAGTVADLNVSYRTSVSSDAVVRCGPNLTLTNLDQSGGTVEVLNGAATVVKTDGTLTLQGPVSGSLKNRGGVLYLDGTGTVALLENGGEAYRRGLAALTITTLRLFAGSRGGAGDAPVAYTNPVEWYECRPPAGPDDRGADVAWWGFGRHKKYTAAGM
ncbi:hypothetical protein GobsT_63550 [Gemmata obscuriglobus]|uniref:Uncharacterized protein n=1 Tax=Gemmata obscuriglobus TaxID=114 RepID=A0A2Z3GV20_9BACT|nr:hypothetical protein [Gemmata obscuriglobus]AWM35912.1 hypothetical protein C1280_02055 [Gemmata obscuriglobus]QEG31533.1 hypothetical protein GobsT_63550 [Gemmata obscuriglobus]VTS10875.1 Uncharacterized protein OS=Planctomyces brasiliensis (strain ATCC 49424 / DSM 5305 / JCM 21570 / NBRC 103401 / IFAM 1448) GN=Plabr_0235 PE=4 SV=1 [Gemmata obscuriglobus UQM 2246]